MVAAIPWSLFTLDYVQTTWQALVLWVPMAAINAVLIHVTLPRLLARRRRTRP